MQGRGGALAPGILFDSDMGRNIDAVLALAMLSGLGRGRVIAIGVSHSRLEGAAFSDVIARFYGGGNLPIGLADDTAKLEASPMLDVPLGMRGEDGQPTYRHNIRTVVDTAEPPVAFRNALLGQQEKQAIAVMAGPATNLVRLLALSGAREIISSKVRLLVTAAGAFGGASEADPRIRADVASAKRLFSQWPSPIVAIGMEAGAAVPFPVQRIESDLGAIPNHPVVSAFRAKPQESSSSIPSQAVLAALYAANAAAEYFKLSPTGTIEVTDDGRTHFKESSSGNHRYLIVEALQKEPITQAFMALASAKPAAGRGGPARN